MKELTSYHLIIITVIIIIGVNGMVLAQNEAQLIVKVVGAQGQSLRGAQVVIEDSRGTTMFNGFTDEQGIVRVEVTYGTYSIWVDYKGFTGYTTASVSSQVGTVSTIATNVFILLAKVLDLPEDALLVLPLPLKDGLGDRVDSREQYYGQ